MGKGGKKQAMMAWYCHFCNKVFMSQAAVKKHQATDCTK